MSQNAVVLHFPVPRTKKRSNYDRFRATMEREWLSKLPQPFKVFENNHFFPRVRQFRFPPAEVPRKVLLYFSYDLQRASHQFAPGIDVACANVIQKEVLNNVFMKHEMSQNESLKPFVQDGVDLEKFGPDSPDKITTLAKKHSALIAKPSWGKAGTGILTSSDPQAIIDHIRTLKDRYFEWRVERYIDNPLLFEGKKFHIGVYILLVRHISWKECKVFYHDNHLFVPAKLPYKQSDWGNKDIHDTHHSRLDFAPPSSREGLFAKLPKSTQESLDANLSKLYEGVTAAIKKEQFRPRNGHKARCVFSVLRMDVMFSKDHQAQLLEVNGAPNLATLDTQLMDGLVAFMAKHVIEATQSGGSYKDVAAGYEEPRNAVDNGAASGRQEAESQRPSKRGRDQPRATAAADEHAPPRKQAGTIANAEKFQELSRSWAPHITTSQEDNNALNRAAECISATNGYDVVKLIVRRFPGYKVAGWQGRRGFLIHYLVEAGSADGLERLLKCYEVSANAQRQSDRATALHLVSRMLSSSSSRDRRCDTSTLHRMRKILLRYDADPRIVDAQGAPALRRSDRSRSRDRNRSHRRPDHSRSYHR